MGPYVGAGAQQVTAHPWRGYITQGDQGTRLRTHATVVDTLLYYHYCTYTELSLNSFYSTFWSDMGMVLESTMQIVTM